MLEQVYWWHDKYRPRKPKYFNRVHTGYEWNKYNQTHYDHDNPPPKIVQGYKFNIFYPDLVDKTKAPTYTIEKDGSNGETCIIRFHAGPPYEDIVSLLSFNFMKDFNFQSIYLFPYVFHDRLSGSLTKNGNILIRKVLSVHLNVEFCTCTSISNAIATEDNFTQDNGSLSVKFLLIERLCGSAILRVNFIRWC